MITVINKTTTEAFGDLKPKKIGAHAASNMLIRMNKVTVFLFVLSEKTKLNHNRTYNTCHTY
jgi:hypothetical protein